SLFVYRDRSALRRSRDWWPYMPVGSSISACGRRCSGSISTIFGIYRWRTHLMHPVDSKKTSTSVRTIQFDDGRLKIEDIVDIAEGSASVALSDASEFRSAIARGADFLDRLLREEGTIYGVTTGYGDSCTVTVPLE